MSDEQNNPIEVHGNETEGVNIDRGARLQNLLNSAAVGLGTASAPTTVQAQPSMRYNAATGEVTSYGNGAETTVNASEFAAPTVEQLVGTIADDGRSISGTWGALVKEHDAMAAKLEACSYDPLTGVKVYAVQGEAREALMRDLTNFRETMAEQSKVLTALKLQREAAARAQAQAFEDAAEVERALDARAAEIAFNAEAQRRADAIIARNKNRG